jgi:hypothetical protein
MDAMRGGGVVVRFGVARCMGGVLARCLGLLCFASIPKSAADIPNGSRTPRFDF